MVYTKHRWRLAVSLLLFGVTAGCRTGRNYLSPDGPRYAGEPVATIDGPSSDTLRVVSFNIEYARGVDSAAVLFANDPSMRNADIILLQEMDAPGARRIAEALGMWHVYYPAIHRLRADQDFGNAILSRWPIVSDAKLTLPHTSRYAGTQRIATAATIRAGSTLVRVYSAHLGTPADISAGSRREQMRTILGDAARYDRVIIGGDMNSGSVGEVARAAGYAWPTEHGPHTTLLGRWDHIFTRGLALPDSNSSGTATSAKGISDHLPVWARAVFPR